MKSFTPLLVSGAACIAVARARASPSSSDYHYTPDWSSWAPVTVYATVTESTTIYVTINSTTTTATTATVIAPTTTTTTTEKDVTIIKSYTTTTPVTTTKPVTATEIIKDIITSTTEQVTITLCTSRDTNPTYTAAIIPLPSDYTWGCPPGYLCKPKQVKCNMEVGLPSEGYYCAPDECIQAISLPVPQLWNADIYGNASPANDPNLKWNPVGSYFDMNPGDWGLSYGIFVENRVVTYTYTTTILEAPTPAVHARQAQTSVPPACYPWCNNCLLEAQAVGKTPALCASGSAFEVDLSDCEQCIAYHKSDSSGTYVTIAPQFQQFINYCAQVSSSTSVGSTTSTYTSTPLPVIQTSSSKTSTSTPPAVTSTSTSLTSSTVLVAPSVSTATPPSSSSVPPSTVVIAPSVSKAPPPSSSSVTPSTVVIAPSVSKAPPPSSSTVTATLTVAGPTTATVGAKSTHITPTTVNPTTPSTWTTTLVLTLSGPTNVSISAYTPDTSHYSTSTLTSTMTLTGPTTITYGGSALASSAAASSKATAPLSTFTGSAVPTIRPNGIWSSIFSVLASMLACVFWI